MDLYGVLDLKGGLVVRADRGRRERYRTIRSPFARSAEPLEVARAFRRELGLETLYVADLDAIEGWPPDTGSLRRLVEDGFRVTIDAGLRSAVDAPALVAARPHALVAALETLPSPDALASVASPGVVKSLVFSLDLMDGEPLGGPCWPRVAEEIARIVVDAGLRRLLVLDLAVVGSREGPRSLDLCRRLRSSFPEVELLSGGGVRGPRDLEAFAAARVDGVLFSSAFHDGALTRRDVDRYRSPAERESVNPAAAGTSPAAQPPGDRLETEGRSA